jgi:hypothetical protein
MFEKPELTSWLSPVESILSFASNGAHLIGIIGAELPIQKSCRPGLAASGAGILRHRAFGCLSWDRFLGGFATTDASARLG